MDEVVHQLKSSFNSPMEEVVDWSYGRSSWPAPTEEVDDPAEMENVVHQLLWKK